MITPARRSRRSHRYRTRVLASALAACAAVSALAVQACRDASSPTSPRRGRSRVVALTEHRRSAHANAREGDLALSSGDGEAALVVSAREAVPGHRPLRGSVVDVTLAGRDRADPLLWWRTGFRDAEDKVHVLVASTVVRTSCGIDRGEGVRVRGTIDGVTMDTTLCADGDGRFQATTSARDLPGGAELVDELNPGSSPALVDVDGASWEGDRTTRFVAIGEAGIGLLLDLPGALPVRRKLVHIATETFPAAITVRYGGTSATRTLHVIEGDALDALARAPAASRAVSVGLGAPGGSFVLQSATGHEMATGVVAPGATRALRLPPDFGASIAFRDDHGVPLGPPRALGSAPVPASPPAARGTLDIALVDGDGRPIPAHVLFRGLDGASDPAPASQPRAVAAGRSLYLLDGRARVALAPGRYEVVATHGMTHTLLQRDVRIDANADVALHATLRRAFDAPAWTGADLHLHAAPSPDAPVALEDRVASLVCEGVDLAVATDHNHITDYAPAARRMALDRRLATIVGDEITSAGKTLWGHFNAFPLKVPTGLPEEATPPYFDIGPAEVFAGARRLGAAIVQVNHPRMPPRIGYFDLAHLDPATGAADPAFSSDFDAVEAFNGIWLETPEKVREGARDLVALARRGMRPTATGNSDSHRLLYEEAGYPRTFVHIAPEPQATRAARAIEALRRGDTTVTSGPLVELKVEGLEIGAIVRPNARKTVRVAVKVSAPAWVPVEAVEIWLDDVVAQRFAVTGPPRDGVRFEGEIELPITRDAVILAWAEAEAPLPPVLPYPKARAIGFTGLTYVDADGDGKVVPAAGTQK